MERRRTRRQARDLVEAENQWQRLVYYWLFSLATRIGAFPSTSRIGLALMKARPPVWALDLGQAEGGVAGDPGGDGPRGH
jgi:hypothetical protein